MILNGDCKDVLEDLPPESIDSLVTDPPAGIAFMGKDWDKDKGGRDAWIEWMSGVMSECYRVLKPGAHGLVWALPRTSHWTATALEDAGFEIRDVVTHLFGSGFPKSHDVSKAIDKAAGAEREVVSNDFYRPDGSKVSKTGSRLGSDYKSTDYGEYNSGAAITAPSTPAAKQWEGWGTALKPASEHWILVRKRDKTDLCEDLALSAVPSTQLTMHGLRKAQDLLAHTVAALNVPLEKKERMLLVGKAVNGLDTTDMSVLAKQVKTIDLNTVSSWKNISDADLEKVRTFTTSTGSSQITDSKTWNYSLSKSTPADTALVPESEHVILIRKPLAKGFTVAQNVQAYGTGAINIDASRVEASDQSDLEKNWDRNQSEKQSKIATALSFKDKSKDLREYKPTERFPANLVLSHHIDCETQLDFEWTDGNSETKETKRCVEYCPVRMLDEQSGYLKNTQGVGKGGGMPNKYVGGKTVKEVKRPKYEEDGGGASRFFYCAKPSKRERNAGLEGTNGHPTVKAKKLMSYLITMITPPGGKVLDPFTGSGSTGVSAKESGFEFLGIEQDKEYTEIARKRFEHAKPHTQP